MTRDLEQFGIGELSVAERLELIGLLWDSITDSTPAQPVPEWHREELERRLEAARANRGVAAPYAEAKARLLARR
jgi:putative addiction module component (TIGR02574 family)